ncbi:hypothetical protein Mapa_001591 [Marchantia paleacea]|nr:hypothetical protein Mapa_001591 [Marchantia paleacea]
MGVYIDGDYRYEGGWSMDKMHGLGIFYYASGASYDGNWEMDKYCGVGIYKVEFLRNKFGTRISLQFSPTQRRTFCGLTVAVTEETGGRTKCMGQEFM